MIGLVRESGGWGDILCMGAAARVCKHEWPGEEVYAFIPGEFSVATDNLEGIDRTISLGPLDDIRDFRRQRDLPLDRQEYPYLRVLDDYPDAKFVDLYCPGFLYESSCPTRLEFSRSMLFAAATGAKDLSEARPVWKLDPGRQEVSRAILERLGVCNDGRSVIAVQMRATCEARCIPFALSHQIMSELALRGHVIYLDCIWPTTPPPPGVVTFINRPIPEVAHVMSVCDLLVGVDSMNIHLAAAVNTRAIAVCGPTDGASLIKSYPGHAVVETDHCPQCPLPCNYHSGKNWSRTCRKTGCARMKQVTLGMVMETVDKVLAETPSPV